MLAEFETGTAGTMGFCLTLLASKMTMVRTELDLNHHFSLVSTVIPGRDTEPWLQSFFRKQVLFFRSKHVSNH